MAEKLQNAVNENAKLQVKQKEEAKLQKGLESKFSSTKTTCDQLIETLQHLDGQVRDAEHDKKVFEDKFLASSEALDSLQLQMTSLTLKNDSTEENVRIYAQSNLERDKGVLQSNNEHYGERLLTSGQEIKGLQGLVHDLVERLIELDKQSAAVSVYEAQLNDAFDTCYKLGKQEKDLAANLGQLQEQLVNVSSDNSALRLDNEGLESKSVELQKFQELLILQYAEENQLAEERVKKMESEADTLILKKTELEMLLTNMEERIEQLSEESEQTEHKLRKLSQTISTLESESRDIQDKLQEKLQGKAKETDGLQKVIVEHEDRVASLANQVGELRGNLEEKEQLHQHYTEREKLLEDQKSEIQASLAAGESTLSETEKQYDMMLESKQLESSKHLKEISLRNDQYIRLTQTAVSSALRKFGKENADVMKIPKHSRKGAPSGAMHLKPYGAQMVARNQSMRVQMSDQIFHSQIPRVIFPSFTLALYEAWQYVQANTPTWLHYLIDGTTIVVIRRLRFLILGVDGCTYCEKRYLVDKNKRRRVDLLPDYSEENEEQSLKYYSELYKKLGELYKLTEKHREDITDAWNRRKDHVVVCSRTKKIYIFNKPGNHIISSAAGNCGLIFDIVQSLKRAQLKLGRPLTIKDCICAYRLISQQKQYTTKKMRCTFVFGKYKFKLVPELVVVEPDDVRNVGPSSYTVIGHGASFANLVLEAKLRVGIEKPETVVAAADAVEAASVCRLSGGLARVGSLSDETREYKEETRRMLWS